MNRLALVTPTYGPDLSRCELLVESVRTCAPGTPHYLIVDKRDHARFRHLAGDSTTILTSEDLLPKHTRRLPGRRSIWMSPGCRPTRGWVIQQVLKIATPLHVEERSLVFVDSDVAFIRPFVLDDVFDADKSELLDVDFSSPEVERWTATACDLLGIDPAGVPVRGHVGNLICWRTENVRGMVDRLEGIAQRDWRKVLMSQSTFSEYILYGAYVRGVLGYETAGHAPSTRPLDKHSWGLDLSAPEALSAFLRDFPAETIAVMIHSKDPIDMDSYRRELHRIWESA